MIKKTDFESLPKGSVHIDWTISLAVFSHIILVKAKTVLSRFICAIGVSRGADAMDFGRAALPPADSSAFASSSCFCLSPRS
jgi:hypothetical protein